jgi:SAM-dependent methyltransferase
MHTPTIEDVSAYWDNRPCNIRHSKHETGSIEYSKEVTRKKYLIEPHIPRFAEFPRWKNKTVLEIGCGIGTDTISFLRHGAKVIAVDLSKESIKIAQQRISAEFTTSPNIQFLHGNIEDDGMISTIRNVTSEPIDLVYSFGVLHHTVDINSAIRNLSRIVRPGTDCKIMVYNKYSIRTLEILLETFPKGASLFPLHSWLDRTVALRSEAQSGCPITHVYTPRSINAILSPFFDTVRIRKEHIFPYDIPAYVRNEYVLRIPYRWLNARTFVTLRKHFGWHLLVDATRTIRTDKEERVS